MKEFKARVKSVSPEIFDEINELLKTHGLDDVDVINIKFKPKDIEMFHCPPGKQPYCWIDVSGRRHCKCI